MIFQVKEINITLNGNPVNGYPLKNNSCLPALHKFLDVTDRLYNNQCGTSIDSAEFNYNFIYGHKFEGESSGQGWVGCELKLDQAYQENMTLVLWIVSASALTIDKFHQIEKLQL